MGNKGKYYTPSIEEFHVGFEYEEKDVCLDFEVLQKIRVDLNQHLEVYYSKVLKSLMKNKKPEFPYELKWKNKEFFGGLNRIQNMLNSDMIRVKYLDEEDIKSLGFNLKEEDINENAFYYKFIKNIFNNVWLELEYCNWFVSSGNNDYIEYTLVKIVEKTNFRTDIKPTIRFSGYVKNKSELKKVLEQVELYNDLNKK